MLFSDNWKTLPNTLFIKLENTIYFRAMGILWNKFKSQENFISKSFHYSTYFSSVFSKSFHQPLFFRIFHIFSLFNLSFFHIFHIISHFNLLGILWNKFKSQENFKTYLCWEYHCVSCVSEWVRNEEK
jgi:hypothetical protein